MGLVPITEAEASYVRSLIEAGIFEEIKSDRLPCQLGTVVVPCGDGHHFADFYQHHMFACGMAHDEPMHHPNSLCGGALLIPEDSPLLFEDGYRYHDDETLLRHIRISHKVKGANAIILASHAPCGMAKAYNLSIKECVVLLVKAMDRVQKMFEELGHKITVSMHFHVFHPDGRRRTYHVNRSACETRLESIAVFA